MNNSDNQESTEEAKDFKKFYIFTGKGGVGKTTLALSFCEYLKKHNQDYIYVYFKHENQKSASHVDSLISEIGINGMSLQLLKCAETYIAKKLKSKTVASWIIKTPFFTSLISMIPGFSYVIYLGQLLEILIDEPKKIIVLDSPSSGHALTMLESTKNFNQIFQDGIIYQDTNLMLDTMKKPNFTKINIVTIPTQLAINESLELKTKIQELEDYDVEILCNNSLMEYSSSNLPASLKSKVENEKIAISSESKEIQTIINYSTQERSATIIKDLVPSLENLV